MTAGLIVAVVGLLVAILGLLVTIAGILWRSAVRWGSVTTQLTQLASNVARIADTFDERITFLERQAWHDPRWRRSG